MARENPTNGSKVIALEICPNISQKARVRTLEGRVRTLALQAESPETSNVRTSARDIQTFDALLPTLKRSNVRTFIMNVQTLHRPTPNHPHASTFERFKRTFKRSNPANHLHVSTFERSRAENPKLMFFRFRTIPLHSKPYQ